MKIYNDSLIFCDNGNISLFLCLDFSSVFDTVGHSLLIQQVETSFGISGFCFKWISSYHSNSSSVVFINNSHSTFSSFLFGILQGSVLSPPLCSLYTSKLSKIISQLFHQIQLYADDLHLYSIS